jgi:hypothetical protein
MDKPDLVFACCKQLWKENEHLDAFNCLAQLVDSLHRAAAISPPSENFDRRRLTAKCFLKLGAWLDALPPPSTSPIGIIDQSNELAPQKKVMDYYCSATEYDPTWYKAWHCLAACHFNAVLYYKQALSNGAFITMAPPPPTPPQPMSPLLPHHASQSTIMMSSGDASVGGGMFPSAATSSISPLVHSRSMPSAIQMISPKAQLEMSINSHALNAVKCFLQAIKLSQGSRLQDTLRYI